MTEQVKYPRTSHLPFSPGATSDDKWASDECLNFLMDSANELIVTEKMDGSNYTMTRNHAFGRSVDANSNHWDNSHKSIWAQIRFDIPEGWRISGENMYARKSVSYDDLPGVFTIFGIWDDNDNLLSWDDTVEWAGMLGLSHVDLLYRGFNFKDAVKTWGSTHDTETSVGFALRSAAKIETGIFSERVAKWVRADHVRTAGDWRRRDDYALNTSSTI